MHFCTVIKINAMINLESTKILILDNSPGYEIGAIIALAVLVYLFYSLIKPEKF